MASRTGYVVDNIGVPIFRSYRIYNRLMVNVTYLLSTIYMMPAKWLISWIHSLLYMTFLCLHFFITQHCIFGAYFLELLISRDLRKIQLKIYQFLPLRKMSKCWGKISRIELPVYSRTMVYFLYSKWYGVNLDETEYPLREYVSLSAFFIRRLKKDCRIVEEGSCAVSPCDGTIVYYGRLTDSLRGVKGIDYDVCNFLGHEPCTQSTTPSMPTALFHCIIYLAPGDYHRFHSPCKWTVLKRNHIPGKLLSVAPRFVRWFPGLLSTNERVVYTGYWKFGYFSYVAVGATNVGSFVVHKDQHLNKDPNLKKSDFVEFDTPLTFDKGEEIGYFAMGSTIVLIFEAPVCFEFVFKINDKIKMGTTMTSLI